MMNMGYMDQAALIRAATVAADNMHFLTRLQEILVSAEEMVRRLQPICNACGECCHFESTEHMLLVSTGELAILASVPPSKPPQAMRCPYQFNGLCTARNRRPLGCRVYYCDKEITLRSQTIYEDAHRSILSLHEHANIPYAYSEMTDWLEAYLAKS